MKHAICIFLSLFLLGVFSLSAGEDLRLRTVVIDAGHGGKDPGCISKDNKTFEKNIALDVALKLSDLITKEYPDVKVILTRSTDKFVELRERAAIANRAGANIFISLHVNAAKNTSANGYSVHILGQSSDKDKDLFAYNMDVVKRENSVILLEDDYKTNYQGFDPSDPESYIFMQLMQNAYLEQSVLMASIISEKLKGGPIKTDRGISQNPFYVLWKTAMPAVLVEMGFMSNTTDLAALRRGDMRLDLADRLFKAFKDYKELYDSSLNIGKGTESPKTESTVRKESAPSAPSTASKAEGTTLYGTQIFATSRQIDPSDSRFMGWKPEIIQLGSLYKYIIGVSASPEEARKNSEAIKKEYPAAFLVQISDGTTSRFK